MALSNFGELKTEVAKWLARDDLDEATFVKLFEATARRDFGGNVMDSVADLTLTNGEGSTDLGFIPRAIKSLAHEDGSFLRQSTMSEIGRMAVLSGKPMLWAWRDGEDNVLFYPTPDAAYTMTMQYKGNFVGLSDDADTNWLLTYYPDIYLYGTLLQARNFLQDEALQVYEAKYEKIKTELKQALIIQTWGPTSATCWTQGAR